MRRLLTVSLLISLLATASSAQTIDDLFLMSEEFPPYNFRENGETKGTSIDLMVLILQKLNSRQGRNDIHILPWARAYKYLLERPDTVLFAMTRTHEREKLFKWVGPISTARNVLIARKEKRITIHSTDDIKRFKVGAVRNDAGAQLVAWKAGTGMEAVTVLPDAIQCIQMLNRGGIDLFAYDENVMAWLINKNSLNPLDYEVVFVLEEGFHYFGFHRETPDPLIEQFQKALDDIKALGTYDAIKKRYLP
ncbi:MAG: substrate-binding periplasmic protein [Thermodesulfobacteriota bacterium]